MTVIGTPCFGNTYLIIIHVAVVKPDDNIYNTTSRSMYMFVNQLPSNAIEVEDLVNII